MVKPTKFNIPLFFKLLLLSGILIIVIIVISLLFNYSYNKLLEKDKVNELVLEFNDLSQTLHSMAERIRDDLHLTFDNDVQNIKNTLKEMSSLAVSLELDKDSTFQRTFNEYKNSIDMFIDKLLALGLTENDGLEGEFRSNIHKLEKFLKNIKDYPSLYYLLQARRREKDFIIRHRQEYVDQVKQNISLLSRRLNEIQRFNDTVKIFLKNYINSFENYFKAYISYRDSYNINHEIQKKLDTYLNARLAKSHKEAEFAYKIVNPIMFGSIVIGVILTLFYAQTITKPVNELQKATLQVANGNLKVKVSIRTNDEFELLAEFFNKMVSSLEQNNLLILRKNQELEQMNEELKVLNATKDKLFSIIAHDLRNPLSSFKSAIEFLNKNYDSLTEEDKKEFLDDINKSAIAVYDLLENLLQWSFAQLNRIKYNPQPFELKLLVDSTIKHLHLQAQNKEIQIHNLVPEKVYVYGDVFMISTIVRNLISNAIKFTNRGGSIWVNCTKNEKDCTVAIQDTGIGIPSEKLEKLFSKGNNSTTRGTENEIGTGLGLLLCKEFIEKHGGKIWVESEVNRGSTFYFTIPIEN